MSLLDSTAEFMRLAKHLEGTPEENWANPEVRKLRQDLVKEELKEFLDAEANNDLVGVIDACMDGIVVLWGTALRYIGEFDSRLAANEVGRSNLSKVDGSLGPIIRRGDDKILKPEGWTPPNIEGVLKAAGLL